MESESATLLKEPRPGGDTHNTAYSGVPRIDRLALAVSGPSVKAYNPLPVDVRTFQIGQSTLQEQLAGHTVDVVAATWMHRYRRRLVHHEQVLRFVDDVDRDVENRMLVVVADVHDAVLLPDLVVEAGHGPPVDEHSAETKGGYLKREQVEESLSVFVILERLHVVSVLVFSIAA